MGYMKKKLYLDDVRVPVDQEWIVAKDYDEFAGIVTLIGLDNIEVISLDHDLGPTAMSEYYNNVQPNYTIDYNNILERTGYDAAKFLVAHSMSTGIPLPQVYVHSANPIGAGNIIGYINNYLKNSRLPLTCVQVKIPHTNSW